MSKIKDLLNKKAEELLDNLNDFDIEECITLQYGDSHYWNQLYAAVRSSHDWEMVRCTYKLTTEEQGLFKMIDLLNHEIEEEYYQRIAFRQVPRKIKDRGGLGSHATDFRSY